MPTKKGTRSIFALIAIAAIALPAAHVHASDRPRASTTVTPAIAERLIRVNTYMEDNNLDDALRVVEELTRVRNLEPADLAQIHRFRGYILVSRGDTDTAAVEFEKSLAQNALDPAAQQGMTYSLAQLYTQSGKYDQASSLIERWFATAEDPKPEAFFLKAMILVQQEKYAEARVPAETAIARMGQPRESWLQLLAAIQFELQDYPAVAGTLEQLVAIAPHTKRYWIQLATIENTIGRGHSAAATLTLAHTARLLDDDKEYRQLARLYFAHDLPMRCAQTVEEGMQKGVIKPDAEAYELLANCLLAARETDRALAPLAKAGELSADGRSLLMLGQLHLQRDRFELAREALSKALTKAPREQRGSIELLVGIAQLGANHFEEAERAFRSATADAKTKAAAETYLKHLEQKRARVEQDRGVNLASAR